MSRFVFMDLHNEKIFACRADNITQAYALFRKFVRKEPIQLDSKWGNKFIGTEGSTELVVDYTCTIQVNTTELNEVTPRQRILSLNK